MAFYCRLYTVVNIYFPILIYAQTIEKHWPESFYLATVTGQCNQHIHSILVYIDF